MNVASGAVYVETLHPTVIGRRFIWEQGKEPQLDEASFAFSETIEFRFTPIQEVNATGKPLRCELHRADCPDDFPVIAEFRSEGMTDYFALPSGSRPAKTMPYPGPRANPAGSPTKILTPFAASTTRLPASRKSLRSDVSQEIFSIPMSAADQGLRYLPVISVGATPLSSMR